MQPLLPTIVAIVVTVALPDMSVCRMMMRYHRRDPTYENSASKPGTMSSMGVPCYESTCATGGYYNEKGPNKGAYSWCYVSEQKWSRCGINGKTSMGLECINDERQQNSVCYYDERFNYRWCYVKDHPKFEKEYSGEFPGVNWDYC